MLKAIIVTNDKYDLKYSRYILVSDGDNELRIITLPHAPCHPSQFFRLLNKQAAAERHDIIANSTMQRTYAVFFCYLFSHFTHSFDEIFTDLGLNKTPGRPTCNHVVVKRSL